MLIREKVEPLDLFEQTIEVFYRTKTANAAFGDSITAAGFLPEKPDFANLASEGEPVGGTLVKVRGFYNQRGQGKVILGANHQIMRRNSEPFLDYELIFLRNERRPLRIMETRHRHYSLRYWHTLLFKDFASNRTTLPYGGQVFVDSDRNQAFGRQSAAQRNEFGAAKALREMPRSLEEQTESRRYFEEILAFVNAQGMEACVVSFPMSATFRQEADRHNAYGEIRRWYGDAAKAHGHRYLDFWALYDDDSLFLDPTHLNDAGGRAFTQVLLESCFATDSANLAPQ